MNKTLQELQKKYGIKLGQHDSEKNRLFNVGLLLLKSIDEYIEQIEKAEMTSEQFFLDFLDNLNASSVKY